MAITVACHVEPVAGSGVASVVATCQSGGAVRNPSQEVEQSHGRYCGLPGGPGLSVEARLESGLRRNPDGNHLSRNLGQGRSW